MRLEVGLAGIDGPFFGDETRELRRNDEALPGELDRRCEQALPRQRPVSLVRGPQSGHRAGYADRAMTGQALAGQHFAPCVEVHVAARGRGRGLAVVEELGLAADPGQQEAAAADVARLGQRDRQREAHGNGHVDRVAALGQHAAGDVGGEGVGHRDRGGGARGGGRNRWWACGRVDARLRRTGSEQRGGKREQQATTTEPDHATTLACRGHDPQPGFRPRRRGIQSSSDTDSRRSRLIRLS